MNRNARALPEIDLGPFIENPHGPLALPCVRALLAACREPGFAYLRGHGVPPELDQAMMRVAARFFALPAADKNAMPIAASPHFRGYTPPGGEWTKGTRDWREQLDLGADETAEAPADAVPAWRRLRGPNPWPASLPEMRPIVTEWMASMDRVGFAVMRALALGLGQPLDFFDRYFTPRGDPHLKIIHYPPQPPDDTSVQGVGLHHDSGLLSFVLQDEVGGLKVLRDGGLIDATPRPGTYVMNLGEMLQRATNGYLRATPHRVDSPANGRGRISVAYFFHPRLESTFEPVALPAALAAAATGGENACAADPVHAVFGENYLKIRLRSHPDVAAAHYADVARQT